MPRRFALDQNFPEPIVDGLVDWLASHAELMPIRRIDKRLATIDDWEVLQALAFSAGLNPTRTLPCARAWKPGRGTCRARPNRPADTLAGHMRLLPASTPHPAR